MKKSHSIGIKGISKPEEKNGFRIAGCELLGYSKNEEVVKIPDGIAEIHDMVFGCHSPVTNKRYNNIKEIIIPDTVGKIGQGAFLNCQSLERIVLPAGLKEIDSTLFYGCKNLQEIHIPESVERIGYRAFRDCTKLKELVIPSNVTKIEDEAFAGCRRLSKLIVRGNIKKVNKNAFWNCGDWLEIIIEGNVCGELLAIQADFAERRRKWEEKKRLDAIEKAKLKQITKNKEELHIFYDANQSELNKSDYDQLIQQLEACYKAYVGKETEWYETADTLALSYSEYQLVWHDESVEKTVKVRIDRHEGNESGIDWEKSWEFPGAEFVILTDIKEDWGDSYSFKHLLHKQILLRNLYNMSGIWKLTIYYKHER